LEEKPAFKRFLKGAEPGETVYLICTSAGIAVSMDPAEALGHTLECG
jgi:hypothetical protein